jgi:hypothetical protein
MSDKAAFDAEFPPEFMARLQTRADAGSLGDLTEWFWVVWCHATAKRAHGENAPETKES